MTVLIRSSMVLKIVVLAMAVTVGASVAAGAAPARASHHGAPVIRSAPSTAPPAARRHGACGVEGRDPFATVSDHGLVWVRHHATGVVSVWLPGLNARGRKCHAARRVSDEKVAQRLAAAIEHAPRLPKGVFCPLDDGTGVRLYFTFAHSADEYVDVSFSGCQAVSAPDRSPRRSTAAISKVLKHIAPGRWASYFPAASAM